MRRREFDRNGVHTYRYAREQPDYALLICHGGGGWGGMYDRFCYPFAERNVDIWSLDLPGFGRTGERGVFTADEQHRAVAALAREIRKAHDRPIFCLGSSLGAYHASAASYLEEVHAVIVSASPILCDGPMVQGMAQLFGGQPVQALLNAPRIGDGLILDLDKVIDWEKNYGDLETARAIVADPNHTGQIMLKSWASMMCWKPPRPLAENTKPFFFMIAEHDPLAPLETTKPTFDAVGGPTELKVFKTDKHQIMLFHTEEYSEILDEWCRRQL